MKLYLPDDCLTDGQQVSYTGKYLPKVLVPWRNSHPDKHDKDFDELIYIPAEKAWRVALKKAIALARLGLHWKPSITEHWIDGEVRFPPGLNMDNEGSVYCHLIGLGHQFGQAGIAVGTLPDFMYKFGLAQRAVINGTYWKPKITDIR